MLRDMDLYKWIILLSLLALPITGYWLMGIEDEISAGEKALAREKTRTSYLLQVGELQGRFEMIDENRRENENLQDPREFFNRMVLTSAAGGTGIGVQDFVIEPERVGPGRGRNAQDIEVGINFGRRGQKIDLSRAYVWALIYNVESPSPVWRLRQLDMSNVETMSLAGSQAKAPPDEIKDSWQVKTLRFARRTEK